MHNVLVESPVVQVGNPDAQQQGRPNDVRVVIRTSHVKLVLVDSREFLPDLGFSSNAFGQVFALIDSRTSVIRGNSQFGNVFLGKRVERNQHDDKSAQKQAGTLKEVCPGAGFQTAGKDVNRSQNADEPAGCYNVNRDSENAHSGEQNVNRQRAGVDNDGNRNSAQNNDHA